MWGEGGRGGRGMAGADNASSWVMALNPRHTGLCAYLVIGSRVSFEGLSVLNCHMAVLLHWFVLYLGLNQTLNKICLQPKPGLSFQLASIV